MSIKNTNKTYPRMEYYNKHKLYTISDIEAANYMQGGLFFSKEALIFFNSKVLGTIYPGKFVVYFITSERQSYKTERLYTVRSFHPYTGCVGTIGDFQAYASAGRAQTAIMNLLKAEDSPSGT